jgi:hypothetical protein
VFGSGGCLQMKSGHRELFNSDRAVGVRGVGAPGCLCLMNSNDGPRLRGSRKIISWRFFGK